jgi:hypothetical protein
VWLAVLVLAVVMRTVPISTAALELLDRVMRVRKQLALATMLVSVLVVVEQQQQVADLPYLELFIQLVLVAMVCSRQLLEPQLIVVVVDEEKQATKAVRTRAFWERMVWATMPQTWVAVLALEEQAATAV